MIQFRPAVRADIKLLIGIAGPQNSGKTYSALRLAKGLAPDGPIYFIDTENRRGLHYADDFDYLHAEMHAPFSSRAYQEALEGAIAAGAKVVIVDSMSHEHEGPGGVLEQHETELQRMAGNDYRKREQMNFAAWIKPKAAHNAFVNAALRMDAHLIFCFRAKPGLAMVKNDRGKREPVNTGWQPICTSRMQFEMTTMLILPEGAEGVPNLSAPATKLQRQHAPFFPPGQAISEQAGAALARWAAGRQTASPSAGGASASPAPSQSRVGTEDGAGPYAVVAKDGRRLPYDSPENWLNAQRQAFARIGDAAGLEAHERRNKDETAKVQAANPEICTAYIEAYHDRLTEMETTNG